MRLALHVTAWLLLGACLVLGVAAFARVKREVLLFETDIRKDHEASGRDLAAGVETIWRLAGEAAAMEFIEQANESKGHVLIRWVWLNASPGSEFAPEIAVQQTPWASDPSGSAFWTRVERDGIPWAYTYLRVVAPQGADGAIELSESLADEERYVRTTMQRVVLSVMAVVLIFGLSAWVLGVLLVGRPVRQLITHARRVADGDLTSVVRLRRRDELSELAEELNTMCRRLAEVDRQAADEAAARRRTVEQLRHADRLSTVGRVASGMAHELGTPLSVILARARMIASREAEDDQAIASARVIVEQSERMTAIIRQILDFARRRKPQKSSVNLSAVAGYAVELIAPLARQRGVTLKVANGGSAVALVDPEQMQQVISNLVVNGIHAMPNGGELVVRVGSQAPPPSSSTGSRGGPIVRIAVEDQGVGIPADKLEEIFEPFYTTRSPQEGTGLGLSIASEIVREHGGWIEVESRVGAGARFCVCLPQEAIPCAAES